MIYIDNKYKRTSIVLILSMLGIYIVNYTGIFSFIPSSILNYGVIPALWIGVIILMQFRLPHIHPVGKIRLRNSVYIAAFNCGVGFIVTNILAGLIQGFGKSPYSHSVQGILTNMIYVGSVLVGRECIRAYLVGTFGRKQDNSSMYIIMAIMTLTSTNLFKISGLNELKGATIFLAEQLIPATCENILATYLVLYGGPLASIIYVGMTEAFEWLSPILPNLDWLAKGVIGMAIPLISLTLVSNYYIKLEKTVKSYRAKDDKLWKWLPTAIASVIIIWFTVGVFPIYPSAIATGSMEPMIYPGDVVLVRKIVDMEGLETLQIGDVIQFKRGDILINHRIMEIIDSDDGLKEYKTKGDNNSAADSQLVKMEDIKGTIEGVIPKIGWPTLILKNNNPDILKEIEF